MASASELTAQVRTALAGTRAVRELRMFGGTAFMLGGKMLVAASPRGLLVRVGKDAYPKALARPGARPMVMRGRAMAGYVFVEPDTLTPRALKSWLALALKFVATLPAKQATLARRRSKPKKKR